MDFNADLIDDRVWLGSLDSTNNVVALDHFNIKHILTLLERSIEIKENAEVSRKHVDVEDVETTDLLAEFESCYEFIEKVLSTDPTSNVLIHCHAGVSRSATIACMWLMRRYQLSAKAALERLKLARPIISPNRSFSAQLYLFEQMNNQLDVRHKLYQEFQLECARAIYIDYDTENKGIDGKNHLRQRFRQAFILPYDHATCTIMQTYICRQCQKHLFNNADLSRHTKNYGLHNWFKKYGSYHSKNLFSPLECGQEVFTGYLEWLMNQIDTPANCHSDAIKCPQCFTIVGWYNLNGRKCSCDTWVVPAFHFNMDKIEEKPVTNLDIETTTSSS